MRFRPILTLITALVVACCAARTQAGQDGPKPPLAGPPAEHPSAAPDRPPEDSSPNSPDRSLELLREQLRTATGTDRILVLAQLAGNRQLTPEERLEFATQIREQAISQQDQLECELLKAQIRVDQGRIDTAKSILREAVAAAVQGASPQVTLHVMHRQFEILFEAGQFQDALNAAGALFAEADRNEAPSYRIDVRVRLAEHLESEGCWPAALQLLGEAHSAAGGNESRRGPVTLRLAELLLASGDADFALQMNRLFRIKEKTDLDPAILIQGRCGAAECLRALGNPVEAEADCHQTLLDFAESVPDGLRHRLNLIIAESLVDQNRLDEAETLTLSLQNFGEQGERFGLRVLWNLARIHVGRRQYDEALSVLDQSATPARRSGKRLELQLQRLRADVLEASGNTSEALALRDQYLRDADELATSVTRWSRWMTAATVAAKLSAEVDSKRSVNRQILKISPASLRRSANPQEDSERRRQELIAEIAREEEVLRRLEAQPGEVRTGQLMLGIRESEEKLESLRNRLQFETTISHLEEKKYADEMHRIALQPELDRRDRTLTVLFVVLVLLLVAVLAVTMNGARRLSHQRQEAAVAMQQLEHQLNEKLQQELEQRTVELKTELVHRERIERALEQTRKAEAIAQLTSGVAHDFNNLMTVVIASNEVLRQRIRSGSDSTMTRLLDDATCAARSAAGITRQLLAYSRRQTLSPRPVNLSSFLDDVTGLLRRTLSDRVTLEVRLECPDRFVQVDRVHLTTALINLCANARDAIQGNGHVVVSAEALRLSDGDGNPAALPDGEFIRIRVTDNGEGMSEEQCRRATEPFFTTKVDESTAVGTGLGLSVVEGFLRQSGGALQIESRPGSGATVECLLPAAEGELAVAESRDSHDTSGVRQSVLIVDDDGPVRRAIECSLSEYGMSTWTASGPDEAMQLLNEGLKPTLLLSDVRMQGSSSGITLARWMQMNHPDVRVVLMTGSTDHLAESEFDVICKPFQVSELMERLRTSDKTSVAALQ